MFQDNNLWFLIFAVLPAIFYSLLIYHKAPKGIVRKKPMWSYIFIGVLSIQILKTIHFLFPHIHQYMESHQVMYSVGDGMFRIVEEPTLWAIFVFAFFQVAFFEELSKWFAFRVGNAVRGDTRSGLDSPFAVMFYSVMIAVGFAVFENIHYVGRALWGDLQGVDPNQMLLVRSLNSVVVHMISGLFMGYFIAIGRRCKNIFKHAGYTILGLLSATAFHGLYDFNLMKPGTMDDYVNIFGLDFHINNNLLIGGCLLICYIMAVHLSKISYNNNGLMR
jgi:RsiW-degrading membrane proteinase PrsW (M82 family)